MAEMRPLAPLARRWDERARAPLETELRVYWGLGPKPFPE